MTETRTPARPGRLHLPTLVAGLVVGGLLAGALAPLVGNDLEVGSDGSTTPDFLTEGDALEGGSTGSTGTTAVTDVAGPGEPGAGDATSSTAQGGTSPGNPGTTGPAVARTASEIGVTPDAMTLGMMLLKCDGCSATGYDYPKNGREMVQVFTDDINDRGGINGRRLDVVVEEFDQLVDALQGGTTQRRACIDLTEKQPIFAAIAVGVTQLECLYDEHATPVIALTPATSDDPGTFNSSNARLWALIPSARRMLVNWADQLIASGTLRRDRPFGIVTIGAQQFDAPVRNYLVPYLESIGYPAAHVAVLPADSGATATARATEGAAMRGKNINTVLLALDFLNSALWIQEAERNQWRPQYTLSDYATPADDTTGALQPASFTGAIAVSSVPVAGAALSPADQQCQRVYQAHTGRSVSGPEEAFLLGSICSSFQIFERGAKNAGVNPTQQSLSQGLAGIGALPIATVVGGNGSLGGQYAFGPVKWSATDEFILKRWDGSRYVQVRGPARMSV